MKQTQKKSSKAKMGDGLQMLKSHWSRRRFNYGMTATEVQDLVEALEVKPEMFWEEFGVNTVTRDELSTLSLYYYVDIERTLAKIKKWRNVSFAEWD